MIGWAPRRAQADHVAVGARELAHKPGAVSWAAAPSIPTAAATAYGAVHAVDPQPGDTVVVSAAAGGVGALVTQLVINAGATVIATAGPDNFDFLRSLGAIPVAHGDGLIDRITRATPDGVTAYLDNYGDGNVDLAVRLGVSSRRRPSRRQRRPHLRRTGPPHRREQTDHSDPDHLLSRTGSHSVRGACTPPRPRKNRAGI